MATFLLTSETKPQDIIAHYKKANTTTIQIVDELEKREYQTLRKELPNVKLVQVILVSDVLVDSDLFWQASKNNIIVPQVSVSFKFMANICLLIRLHWECREAHFQ